MHLPTPIRRIIAWLAILGYTLVASGLPLPLGNMCADATNSPAAKRLAGKDRSKPFPCMDKPCGCATAEQCFSSCCCHTLAERLAWAKLHNVHSAVLVALEHRVARNALTDRLAIASPAPKKPSCCSSQHPARASCCSSEPAASPLPPSGPEAPGSQERESPRSKTVTLRAMLACGGIAAQWFSMAVSLPPPGVDISVTFHVVERLLLIDDIAECLHASPAARPPCASSPS